MLASLAGAPTCRPYGTGLLDKGGARQQHKLARAQAAHLAFRHFQEIVQGHHVLIMTNNVATKVHINRQGGTHSRSPRSTWVLGQRSISSPNSGAHCWAHECAGGLFEQDHDRPLRMKASPGHLQGDVSEIWSPDRGSVCLPGECPSPTFLHQVSSPGSRGTNALCSPWPSGLRYAFPPLPLILAVIRKVLVERVEVLLVAPHWPRCLWYADLVSLLFSRPWRIPQEKIALSQGSWSTRSLNGSI